MTLTPFSSNRRRRCHGIELGDVDVVALADREHGERVAVPGEHLLHALHHVRRAVLGAAPDGPNTRSGLCHRPAQPPNMYRYGNARNGPRAGA